MNYYKSSGKFNLLNLPLGLITGSILAVIVAFLYVWIGSWVSFIVLKVIIIGLVVMLISVITELSNRISKNRNRIVSLLSALLFSAVLLVSSWIFFVVLILKRDFSDAIPNLWIYVKLLFTVQEYAVTTPLSWFGNHSGTKVSNWETYVVLCGEAIMLLFGPVYYMLKFDNQTKMAYCESCNRWTKKIKKIKKEYFKVFTKSQLEEMIDKGDLSELLELAVAAENSKEYYEIKLFSCGNCNNSNYMKISKETIKWSRKKEEDVSSVLIDYCLLENEDLISSLLHHPTK